MGDSPVVRSLDTLPRRFRGQDERLSARFRVQVGRAVRDVVVADNECSVIKANGVRPDVEISTDPDTWWEMEQGRLSGIEAFAQKKLIVRVP
jgi:putative sterol carrier protein